MLEGGFHEKLSYNGVDSLIVEECQFVALIAEIGPYFLCFAPARSRTTPFVDVLGAALRGNIGIVPKASIALFMSFTMVYSTTSRKLKLCYSFFPFNHQGMLIGNDYANIDYAVELSNKRDEENSD